MPITPSKISFREALSKHRNKRVSEVNKVRNNTPSIMNKLNENEVEPFIRLKKMVKERELTIIDDTFALRALRGKEYSLKCYIRNNIDEAIELLTRASKLIILYQPSKITLEEVKKEYNSGVTFRIK